VEYILIIVVVLALATIMMNKFFKPFQKWADYFIGTYIECLLDQGQLPGLGGSEPGVQDCEPPEPWGKGGLAGEGGGNSSGSQGSGSDTDGANGKNKKRGSSESEGGDGGGGARGRVRYVNSKRVRFGGTDAGGSGANNGAIVAEAENKQEKNKGFYGGRRFNTGMRVDQGRGQRVYGLAGMLENEREKIKKREEKVQKAIAAVSEDAANNGAKKFEVKPTEKRQVATDLNVGEWSFGKLFRILLIIGISIALILFVGGQLVQISKGMEK
jgi:hypothetical protein